MAAFLDPGLDYSSETLASDEAERYLAWCRTVHGEGNLDLVPFAEFFVEFDPAGLKYLRRQTAQIRLPVGPAVLMWAHTYCVLGSSKGTLYEVIAARELGASRTQVVDVIRCAGYLAGPFALNAAGELTLDYLRAWPESHQGGLSWPAEWFVNPEALASGIDHRVDELQPGEFDLIATWYRRTYGDVPPGLVAAAEFNPAAFKLARVRFERLGHASLPVQLIPLLMLHTAVVQGRRLAVRRAAQLALAVGIDRRMLADVVHWGAVLGGEAILEMAMEAVSSV
jgi:hypothetical protein